MAHIYAAHFAFSSQLDFHFSKFPSIWGHMHNSCAFQRFPSLLVTFCIYFLPFFFLQFPPNIAHPLGIKQRIKLPNQDQLPCNLSKQMANTRCFRETGHRRLLLSVTAACVYHLNASCWWQSKPCKAHDFHFHLWCLLTWEMLVLMENRK